ncbi:flagellar hook-associated protein FlgK [Piscinibacter koreensis]|uniref:Flagellar hook-associated protein 1 n=1 Tax=Piscinibacter koreensis TaxID=2742824 RepID=A0A7Y6NPE8_9BURK|nr:flagellar hook-associated protein FlgK [Schlegelella koreensis]NUZ06817.1 flagellar hook-associated protein FlgK [Schlegelella koreensis]
MAVSALLGLGARAMAANYAALQVTGNNIANANTDGYSRQSVQLETAGGQRTGAGFFGNGVNVVTVTRSHSEFLTREAALTRAIASFDETRSAQLQMLEQVFPMGESGIGYAAQQMFGSFVDVASRPQDASARQVALASVGDVAARFRGAADQIDTLQGGVVIEAKASVASVNTLSKQIAELNRRIALDTNAGHKPNDLLDQRDRAINDLSQFVQVSTIAQGDGQVGVFIGSGQRLVQGSSWVPMLTLPDPYDPAKIQVGLSDGATPRAFPPDFLAAGSIAGLLKFQDKDLGDARNLLGQMAAAITDGLNRQQALGIDLRQPAGSGTPLLSVGGPMVRASTNNAQSGGVPVASYVNGSGQRVPSVGLTIVAANELQASDYELYADPNGAPGTYQLTRLSDGVVSTVGNGSIVDGIRIDIAAPAPAGGDRFRLEPVSAAARNMTRVLDDPRGIAAASPVTGRTGAANTGTASIASVVATSPALNANLTATLTFTDNVGGFSYTLVDSTGVLPTTTGTGSWTANQPIALNGWSMQLAGVPRAGDTLTVQKTAFPAGDNGNANALLALRDAALVGQQTVGGVVVKGATVTDAYAAALADVGVRVQSAKLSAEQSASIATDAKTAETSKSGVNLDEEAARLLQFQQSYQAAAKMLQVAQTLFDSLLQAAGR